MSLSLRLFAPLIPVFEHTPFVVNRTFNDTLTERLEQRVLE